MFGYTNPDMDRYDDLLDSEYEERSDCLNMAIFSDECELFYDLDLGEALELHCDTEGMCLYDFNNCPYYQGVWDYD